MSIDAVVDFGSPLRLVSVIESSDPIVEDIDAEVSSYRKSGFGGASSGIEASFAVDGS